MNLKRIILTFVYATTLYSCANYSVKDGMKKKERRRYAWRSTQNCGSPVIKTVVRYMCVRRIDVF